MLGRPRRACLPGPGPGGGCRILDLSGITLVGQENRVRPELAPFYKAFTPSVCPWSSALHTSAVGPPGASRRRSSIYSVPVSPVRGSLYRDPAPAPSDVVPGRTVGCSPWQPQSCPFPGCARAALAAWLPPRPCLVQGGPLAWLSLDAYSGWFSGSSFEISPPWWGGIRLRCSVPATGRCTRRFGLLPAAAGGTGVYVGYGVVGRSRRRGFVGCWGACCGQREETCADQDHGSLVGRELTDCCCQGGLARPSWAQTIRRRWGQGFACSTGFVYLVIGGAFAPVDPPVRTSMIATAFRTMSASRRCPTSLFQPVMAAT